MRSSSCVFGSKLARHQYSTPSDHKGKSQLEDAPTTASEWRRRNPRGAVARPSWYRQEADACESVSATRARSQFALRRRAGHEGLVNHWSAVRRRDSGDGLTVIRIIATVEIAAILEFQFVRASSDARNQELSARSLCTCPALTSALSSLDVFW
jgi:hypothetical protein